MRKKLTLLFVTLVCTGLFAQQDLGYQTPKKALNDLIDVDLAPTVLRDSKDEHMVFAYRPTYKSIEELSQPELRIAGLRLDPNTHIGSRTTYYTKVEVVDLKQKERRLQVEGLPQNPRLANFSWSPDESYVAMTHTTSTGVELWVLNVAQQKAKRLYEAKLNASLGSQFVWLKNSKELLIKVVPEDKEALIDTSKKTPTGPKVTENNGEKAQNRTYQDLIKNPSDAYNFKQLTRANILKVSLKGETSSFLDTRMYRAIRISPDGKYVMISFLKEPFSYLVTYSRFPLETHVYDMNANLIKLVDDSPLEEVRPKGFMATKKGKRSLAWRADKASTLYFTQALDEGDPQNEVAYRDALYQWKAPFNEAPEMTVMVKNRISNVIWGNDKTAVISDRWWNTRNTKTYVFDPSKSEQIPQLIFDRNYQDVYSDPGRFVTQKSKYNTYVLSLEGNNAFLIGSGFSDKGQFPFVDRLNLSNANASRVYESSYTDKYEGILDYESDKNRLYVRIESQKEFPNYYYRNLDEQSELDQLTSFENPFKALAEVEKELVSYQRKDGLELSGVLYTPAGYDKTNPDPLPMILWAYPREYKDKSSAAQKTNNPNRFIYPSWGSPIYWVTQGYVVLDRAAFPIIGEGDTEPNDSFRPQLVANAEAAIDAVVGLGYADRDRVAVGGHSYGAFMVANLLSHSNLFAAGIARSGAYNRTLTPFGFQSEPRSYWEAPEVYYTMSPFMHADKMKTPLLLVHGEEDNNSGTYPMQSERYYNALKGLGATTRLVMFPKESHGYRAKETILHLIWEQDRWLEKHVKSKKTDLSKEKTPKG